MERTVNLPRPDELAMARQAAQWLEILKTAGTAERAAFAKWVKESPAHLREFLAITALDRELSGIDPHKQRDIELMLNDARGNVVQLQDASSTIAGARGSEERRMRRPIGKVFGIAATLAALGVAIVLASLIRPGVATYSTAVGEQRAVELEDGSILQVNTASRLEVDFSDTGRDVRLIEGEALFKVAHEAARPFRVRVAGSTIQALGTQFNVHRQSDEIAVAVLEGLVQISPDGSRTDPTRVAGGKRVRIARDGRVSIEKAADVSRDVTWRQRRLAFRGASLAEMANEFNRYNRSPRLVIEGQAVRGREFTANFDADDPESLVDFLAGYDDLVFEKRGAEIMIRGR